MRLTLSRVVCVVQRHPFRAGAAAAAAAVCVVGAALWIRLGPIPPGRQLPQPMDGERRRYNKEQPDSETKPSQAACPAEGPGDLVKPDRQRRGAKCRRPCKTEGIQTEDRCRHGQSYVSDRRLPMGADRFLSLFPGFPTRDVRNGRIGHFWEAKLLRRAS